MMIVVAGFLGGLGFLVVAAAAPKENGLSSHLPTVEAVRSCEPWGAVGPCPRWAADPVPAFAYV